MVRACDVCGLTEFTVEGGFHYCAECGAKSQQHGQEMVTEIDETAKVHSGPTIKLKPQAKKKLQRITSWEQVNYILVGYADLLVTLGADEDFKLTLLQLWTTYLRRYEIAFFDKDAPERPRLSVYYNKEDAAIIYNRARERRKRKRRPSVASASSLNAASSTAEGSDAASQRSHKKARNRQQRQVLSAEYDTIVASQQSDVNRSLHDLSVRSLNASLSGTDTDTSGASSVKHPLRYSRLARVHLKRREGMSTKHINKHETDTENEMTCHRKPERPYRSGDPQNLTQLVIHALLGLALNASSSAPQLADLIRFSREEHISAKSILQYLPEELDPGCYAESLRRLQDDVVAHYQLRKTTAELMKFLHVRPVLPDMRALCARYLKELCLPEDLLMYIERLMAVFPPKVADPRHFPNYEGRAIAFIIFVLKLLFGLNDSTEEKMSKSAAKLNRRLTECSDHYKPVFVFSEWARYLKTRELILGQVSHSINRTVATEHGVGFDVDLFLDHNTKRLSCEDSFQSSVFAKKNRNRKRAPHVRNLKDVVDNILDSKRREGVLGSTHRCIQFEPSLTPYWSYLSTFLLAYNKDGAVHVPSYMQVDHSERTVIPLVEPAQLKGLLLRNHQLSLTTKRAKSARDSFRFVDSAVLNENLTRFDFTESPFLYADVNVDEESWEPPTKVPPRTTLSHDAIFQKILIRNAVEQQKTDLIANICKPFSLSGDLANESASFLSESMFSSQLSNDQPSTSTSFTAPGTPLTLLTPNYDYWVRFFDPTTEANSIAQFEERIAPDLPHNFQLVLAECARVVENWPYTLYLELMTLEQYFFHAVQPIERFFHDGQGDDDTANVEVQFEDIAGMEFSLRRKVQNAMRDY